MRLHLVQMPWADLRTPSLALTALEQLIRSAGTDIDLTVRYANIDWFDFLNSRIGFTLDQNVSQTSQDFGIFVGEACFKEALDGTPLTELQVEQLTPSRTAQELFARIAPHVVDFVSGLAREITESGAEIVGVSSVFQQNTASLSLLKAIKEIDPSIITLFGGANAEGVMGTTILENYCFVDLVYRGRAEQGLNELLESLAKGDGRQLVSIPGLCYRDGPSVHTNPPLLSTQRVPVRPEFGTYRSRLEKSPAHRGLIPIAPIETSTGCWWGQKHHCKFCGLNGDDLEFAQVDADRAQLVCTASQQLFTPIVAAVDNILSLDAFRQDMEALANLPYDLSIMYETKANLSTQQIRQLAAAGVNQIQPGIESLSSSILSEMRKGVTAAQNVAMIRDCFSFGIHPAWNLLYGFPGETEHDYLRVLEQLPNLHHLYPPAGYGPIRLARFSPYFEDPSLGFSEHHADSNYSLIYNLPQEVCDSLAYHHGTSTLGIARTPVVQLLAKALEEWRAAFKTSSLVGLPMLDGGTLIRNHRKQRTDWSELLLNPQESSVLTFLNRPHTVSAVISRFSAQGYGGAALNELVDSWRQLGLVFEDDNGTFTSLVTRNDLPAGWKL